MSPPPEAPHDPASDATSRIGDILASAEREVADIIAAAERRSAAEHEARTRGLDARSDELDAREAALLRRDAELAERAARVDARAARVQARAAELSEITSGLLTSALGVQDHAERLQGLPGLEDDDDPGPSQNGGGSAGYDPVPAPTALRRRSFGPVPTSAPDAPAAPHRPATGLRSVGPDERLDRRDEGAPVADPTPARVEPDGAPEALEPAAAGSPRGEGGDPAGDGATGDGAAAHGATADGATADGATVHGATAVGEPEDLSHPGATPDAGPDDGGLPLNGSDAHAVPAYEAGADEPGAASDSGTAGEAVAPAAEAPSGTAAPSGGAPRADDDDRVDSPDKIDSARLVALSMAAEGRPRDDVEAYIRDELRIKDHASLIDYVFGISTPSSVVPSWPPRRRRRPS
jgi:hypothetical protein